MRRVIGISEFITRAMAVHNCKYDYGLVNYLKSSIKVKIICPKHGIFEQRPAMHLRGAGCPMCWQERRKGMQRGPYKGNNSMTKKCPRCNGVFPKTIEFFTGNKGVSDGLSCYCRSCLSDIQKEYREKNPAKIKDIISRNNRKMRDSGYRRAYYKKKRETDVSFNITNNLRNRIWRALRRGDSARGGTLWELTGCSLLELKSWLESKFKEGMSWGNHGNYGWHIDHIIPCAAFDLSDIEQQKRCFHYTNLQPLWAHDNLAKKDKIIE